MSTMSNNVQDRHHKWVKGNSEEITIECTKVTFILTWKTQKFSIHEHNISPPSKSFIVCGTYIVSFWVKHFKVICRFINFGSHCSLVSPNYVLSTATLLDIIMYRISKFSLYSSCIYVHMYMLSPGVVIITTPASPLPIELVAITENV